MPAEAGDTSKVQLCKGKLAATQCPRQEFWTPARRGDGARVPGQLAVDSGACGTALCGWRRCWPHWFDELDPAAIASPREAQPAMRRFADAHRAQKS